MNKINWSNFDGDSFQSFCNALLSFEISKKVEIFGAKGTDKGIDARFSGKYSTEEGKWRFQAKFHLTDRKKAVSHLKRQIKEDILGRIEADGKASHVTDEDFLIFLTNVELLPQEKDELLQIAVDALRQHGKSHVKFDLWDGEKLFTLCLKFPVIRLWYEKGPTVQLGDYKSVFERELNASSADNYTLNNKFVSRQSHMKELEAFYKNDSVSTAIITGEAGIGKTRLCMEFFRLFIDENDEWVALVLTGKTVDIDKINRGLASEKNFILLIDDAHIYSPEIIADMKGTVDTYSGQFVH